MKIAFILSVFPLLSETFILNQITGLMDRGHTVDIFAEMPQNSPPMHEDVQNYKMLERTCYHNEIYKRIPKHIIQRLMTGTGYIFKFISKNPMPLFRSLNLFKYGKKAASLELLFKTIPFLDKGPYDIIHAHFGPNGNFGIFLKDLRAMKGKVITAFHGYDMTRYIKKNGYHVYDDLFARGDVFLPISNFWKERLISLGCKENKIVVHKMGIDINKFSFTPRKPKMNSKIQLLTIARLVEKKGVEYGIKAFAKAVKKHPELEYRIIGDGPLKKNLEVLINDLHVADNVRLLGWKNQDEIVALMKHADILLAPSVTGKDGDKEGIPVVLMEALAQGLPVISTLHSGIPELVKDGVSGYLVPERDVDSLAEKLTYLAEHQEVWPQMGGAGRADIEADYDINKLNDELVAIYEQALSDRRQVTV